MTFLAAELSPQRRMPRTKNGQAKAASQQERA